MHIKYELVNCKLANSFYMLEGPLSKFFLMRKHFFAFKSFIPLPSTKMMGSWNTFGFQDSYFFMFYQIQL